ncbi:MAG: hypothetical protein ACI9WU_004173 [Myxococcota bacterium]|jgi:hypothetical protein
MGRSAARNPGVINRGAGGNQSSMPQRETQPTIRLAIPLPDDLAPHIRQRLGSKDPAAITWRITSDQQLEQLLDTLLGQLPLSHLSQGAVTVHFDARAVYLNGVFTPLTATEFDVLVALMRHPGQAVSRAELLVAAGRDDVVVGERTVDVHVSRLRRKLADGDVQIRSVRGSGYVLVSD